MSEHETPFDLGDYMEAWYEQAIPKDQIPADFQREVPLPGGRTQVIDTRVPGWSYDPGQGKMVVCPETWNDGIEPDTW